MKHCKYKYKYVHVFWAKGEWGNRVVEFINNEKYSFNTKEHAFVTIYEDQFKIIGKYDNTFYIKQDKINSAEIINKSAQLGYWIILHGMPKAVDAMLIKKNICSRIIWRTWGHDQIFLVNSNPIKNILKRCILRLLPKKINSFYAVGIANLVDSISINEKFGNNKMYYLPYNLCENNYGKKTYIIVNARKYF